MKKVQIAIQSVTDLITNSSSEVFIIHASEPSLKEIEETIRKVFEICGEDIDECLTFEYADEDGSDNGWDYDWKKGDLIIHSTGDNSIPYYLMEFIESYPRSTNKYDNEIGYWDVQRHHLG